VLIEGGAWPCCGTFWVHTAEIRGRSKADYVLIRDRLIEWSEQMSRVKKSAQREDLGNISHWYALMAEHRPSWYCGRIAEYTWAVLLARKKVIENAPEFDFRRTAVF
jgi:hypothetical protein